MHCISHSLYFTTYTYAPPEAVAATAAVMYEVIAYCVGISTVRVFLTVWVILL